MLNRSYIGIHISYFLSYSYSTLTDESKSQFVSSRGICIFLWTIQSLVAKG